MKAAKAKEGIVVNNTGVQDLGFGCCLQVRQRDQAKVI